MRTEGSGLWQRLQASYITYLVHMTAIIHGWLPSFASADTCLFIQCCQAYAALTELSRHKYLIYIASKVAAHCAIVSDHLCTGNPFEHFALISLTTFFSLGKKWMISSNHWRVDVRQPQGSSKGMETFVSLAIENTFKGMHNIINTSDLSHGNFSTLGLNIIIIFLLQSGDLNNVHIFTCSQLCEELT